MPDSVELKTIKKCTSALETALREIDRDLVHFLNDEGFIRDEAHDTILNSSSRSEASKAGELVTRIKTTVDLDPAKYHTLISWFKEKGASYQPIVNILEDEYRRQSGSLPAQEMLPHGARGVPSGVQYPQGPHQAGPYQLAGPYQQGAGQFGQYNQTQQQGPLPNPTPVQYQPPSLYSGTPGNLQGYVSGVYQQQHAATWIPAMQQPVPAYHPIPPQGPSPRGYGPGEQQNAASWNPAMQQPGPPYHPTPPQGPSPRGYWPGVQQNAASWNPAMQQPGPAYHPPPHHPVPDVPNGRATNGVSNVSGPGIGAPQNLSYEHYVSCIPVQHRSKLDHEVDFENNGADLHLGEIADVLEDWEDVAPALGLTSIEISDIQDSIQRPSLRRRAALRKWKSSQFGYQSTYGSLLQIFTTIRRFKCAEKIVKLLGGNGQPISAPMNQHPPIHQGYQPPPPPPLSQQQGYDMRYQQPSFHPSSSLPGYGNPTQAPPPSTYSGSSGNDYGHPAEYTDGGGGASLPRQADYPDDRSRGAPVKRQRLDHSAEFTLLDITRALKIVPSKKYMTLGLSMRVEDGAVRTFEQDWPRDSDRVLLEIVSLWLRNITQPKPSWQELENVLDKIL